MSQTNTHSHGGAHTHSHDAAHGSAQAHTQQDPNEDPTAFWERRYAESDRIWSGRVNQALAAIAADWTPGRSLDLGCGEGGDVLWFAERGWEATGIDLSQTAVARARVEAADRGLDGAHFVAADLADWVAQSAQIDGSDQPFDLITASFMLSPVELPRQQILRAALTRLAPGGRLVVLTHVAPPPSMEGNHDFGFLSPADELEQLGLGLSEDVHEVEGWTVEVAEVREREGAAAGSDEQQLHMEDAVVVVRRTR